MGWSTVTALKCLFISLNPLSPAEAAKPPNHCYKYPTVLQRIILWSRIFFLNRLIIMFKTNETVGLNTYPFLNMQNLISAVEF